MLMMMMMMMVMMMMGIGMMMMMMMIDDDDDDEAVGGLGASPFHASGPVALVAGGAGLPGIKSRGAGVSTIRYNRR
jgi:hypothetical protein